jgi:mannosyltransferase
MVASRTRALCARDATGGLGCTALATSTLTPVSVGTASREARGPAPAWVSWTHQLGVHGAIVVALTAAAAALRFSLLAHQGFWFDEANTSQLVSYSPGPMLTLIKHYESTPPLYYCVAWVWARIFGFGEAGLRSLSAFAGVLAVPVAYGAAARLISRRAGLMAAALTAFSPLLIWYSQEARAYEFVVLLSSLSLLTFAFALHKPSPRALGLWAAACWLALASEYYAVLVVVPEALWLIYTHRYGAARRRTLITGAVLAVFAAPLLWFAISQNATGHASWIAPIPLAPRLDQIIPQFTVGLQLPAQTILTRVGEAAALVALVLLFTRSERLERRGALIAGSIALGGFLINLLLIAGGIDDLITRNVISLWMPAAVAVAGGLAAARARTLGLACAVILCAIGLTNKIGVATTYNFQKPDWRSVASVLGPRPASGVSRAILIQRYKVILPLRLYMPGLRFWPEKQQGPAPTDFLPAGTQRISELDVVAIAAPRVTLCWWGAACNLNPSTLQRSYAIPGMHVAWVRHAHQFSILRLVASRPVAVGVPTISRALTETTLRGARGDVLLVQR